MQLHETVRSTRSLKILAVVAVVLQLALAPQISIAQGTVNFMAVLAIVLSLTVEVRTSVIIGFLCGLLFDFTSTAPAGLLTLILTVACFVVSSSSRGAMGGISTDSVRLCGVAFLTVNLVYGLCLFVMGLQTSLLWALLGHGISSTVLDNLVAAAFLAVMGPVGGSRGFTAKTRGSSRYKLSR